MRTSKLLAAVLIVAAVGGRAVSSGTALRLSQQPRGQRPRTTAAPRQRTALPRSATFREVRGRGLLISTWINSQGPFNFAIDTGAGITIISQRAASAAAVTIQPGPGPQIAGMSGNVVTAQAATARTIAVGDAENLLPGKTDMIVSTGLPRDLDGLLDPNDVFGSLGYTIDIPHGQLSFFDPRESPLSPRTPPRDGTVVNWLQQGGSHRPFVLLSTGEQALLDTGSSLGLGVHDSNPAAPYSRSSAVHDVGGSVSTRQVAPRTVSIGALELRGVPTVVISGATADSPVLLGLNAVRPFKMRFDPLHKLIEIAPSY